MNFDKFSELAMDYSIIPVAEVITADFLTPVSAYIRLRERNKNCFLFESVEGIGTLARYSFIGINPKKVFFNNGLNLTIKEDETSKIMRLSIFDYLKKEIAYRKAPLLTGLPCFSGGIVGFLGFENISLIEESIRFNYSGKPDFPDSIFGIYDSIVTFDHLKHQIIIIQNVELKNGDSLLQAFNVAKEKIEKMKQDLSRKVSYKSDFSFTDIYDEELTDECFINLVEKAKENIGMGDVFQLVLSKRFYSEYKGDLFNVYRALRIINPSPYMYYMEFDGEPVIIGTSPEDLLKVQNGKVTILPIAGTRKRGKDNFEDDSLSEELLNDPKEIAEHTMLVDLARNDLGRVCRYGSVKLTEEMKVHYFSHVMHIVSRVEGVLSEEKDCIDALKASFPAGTVTGAPKIRATQLINEYEPVKRGIYAGAVGYIDFKGDLDMCIAIRTLFADKNMIYRQAGAGIVADSKPELELKEIKNKSAVLLNALKFAEVIDENSGN